MIGRCRRTWPRHSGHCAHTHLFVLVRSTYVQGTTCRILESGPESERGWMRAESGLSKHLHAASLHSYLPCVKHKSSYIYTPLGLPPERGEIYATIKFNPSCNCNLMKEWVTAVDVKGLRENVDGGCRGEPIKGKDEVDEMKFQANSLISSKIYRMFRIKDDRVEGFLFSETWLCTKRVSDKIFKVLREKKIDNLES